MILEKNALTGFIYGLNFSFKMFWVYLEKKSPKIFPAGPFFLLLQLHVYRSALILRNLPRPEKFLVTRLRPETCNFIKKDTLAHRFSCEFCEILKNIFYSWNTTSGYFCHYVFYHNSQVTCLHNTLPQLVTQETNDYVRKLTHWKLIICMNMCDREEIYLFL